MRKLPCAPLALSLLVAAPAIAADADGDGVLDGADAFPCDATAAALSAYPAVDTYGILLFEDQWPNAGDLDFDDAVLRYNYQAKQDGSGGTVHLRLTLDPVALGGIFTNGVGLHLPVARTAISRVDVTIGAGSPQAVALQADVEATFQIATDLRALFGNQGGQINSQPAAGLVAGQQIVVDVHFASATALDMTQAPFDLYLFRSNDDAHEIHRSGYAGTTRMNGALFNSGDDASAGGRYFIDAAGLPFVLDVPDLCAYPAEGQPISSLYPDIVPWAASGGTSNPDWYSSTVQTAFAYPHWGGTCSNAPATGIPTFVGDRGCVGLVFGGTGGCQDYIVPASVTTMTAKVWGAGGGGTVVNGGGNGGGGAFVSSSFSVTPGETLKLCVGKGGALKTQDHWHGGGGGGLSGIFRGSYAQANAIVVAGGGGGSVHCANGGGGGAPNGAAGLGCRNHAFGGRGGTTTAGGAAGYHVSRSGPGAGSALNGGRGGDPEHSGWSADVFGGGKAGAIGGGGGGGYFGGGGGGHHHGHDGGGGGGGSSYSIDPGAIFQAGGAPNPGGQGDGDWDGLAGRGGTGGVTGNDGRIVLGYTSP